MQAGKRKAGSVPAFADHLFLLRTWWTLIHSTFQSAKCHWQGSGRSFLLAPSPLRADLGSGGSFPGQEVVTGLLCSAASITPGSGCCWRDAGERPPARSAPRQRSVTFQSHTDVGTVPARGSSLGLRSSCMGPSAGWEGAHGRALSWSGMERGKRNPCNRPG